MKLKPASEIDLKGIAGKIFKSDLENVIKSCPHCDRSLASGTQALTFVGCRLSALAVINTLRMPGFALCLRLRVMASGQRMQSHHDVDGYVGQ